MCSAVTGRRMSDTFAYLKMFAQFPFAARRFLAYTLTHAQAQDIVRDRMAHRAENFLHIVEHSIYAYPNSPYAQLLHHAGYTLADLRTLVETKGLEEALRTLHDAGVYVTFEEFKGRKPIVRDGLTLDVKPSDFDNPHARRAFALTTGGSTGLANAVYHDFDHIAAGAPHQLLMLNAWNLVDVPMLAWLQILPGGGIRFLLQRAAVRQYAQAWYSSLGWRDSATWVKYAAATVYMTLWMQLLGGRIPFPKIVRQKDALVIARWMRETITKTGHCLLYCNVSHALRVCVAAQENGLDLTGATIRIGGEPITPVKVAQIERVGARVMPAYGAIDTGAIGLGCADSEHIGDEHLLHDAYALITTPYHVQGINVTVPAFNLTSLLDTSPKLMLNYQIDDYGIVEERQCRCALGAMGYTTHLREIRSYSKSVGEGVTLIGNELQQILDQVLPARFGGSSLDYQWMEQEDAQGITRLNLIISPRLEITDESEVVRVVLNAMRTSSPTADSARTVWQQVNTIQVKRMEPVLTARGKLLPLHIERNPKNQGTK